MGNSLSNASSAELVSTDFNPSISYTPKVFSTQGRIGRLRWLCYQAGLLMLLGLVVTAIVFMVFGIEQVQSYIEKKNDGGSTGFIIFCVTAFVAAISITIITSVRRLHDIDKSGWFAGLLFIPIIGSMFSLALLFIPGTEGSNQFGPQPSPNSIGVKVFGVFLAFTMLMALLYPTPPKITNTPTPSEPTPSHPS